MCGISGIVSKNNINLASIAQMNAIIKHRGPDDEGFALFNKTNCLIAGGNDTAKETWQATESYCPQIHIKDINENVQIAFGHRRLSILDLSPKGHQPMCSKDKRYWITYNGEVYNYIEIRKELEDLGHQFTTNTDTEVIINAYVEWGSDCQHKFNGMWAFAMYDHQTKNIFLSRDRFGIKPLYYWFSPTGDFCFASEIKQFTVLPNWKAILNERMAYDFLYYSTTDHCEETLFKGVYHIPPGNECCFSIHELTAQAKNKKLKTKQWYNPVIKPFKGSFEEAKKQFLSLFKQSVELHLRADVPIGSALSGGLDSSSIVSYINLLLQKEGKTELQKTFSSCSDDKKYDEREWMDEVVKATNVDGHFVYPQGKDIFTKTEKIVWHLDEPYQSQTAFMGYHVFEEAARNKVRVLLNGQGADEYLSCYGDIRFLRQLELLKKVKLNSLVKELGSVKSLWQFIFIAFYKAVPNSIKYFKPLNQLAYKQINDLVNNSLITAKPHINLLFNKKPLDRLGVSIFQLFRDPLPRYLRWEDRNSMAHTVEARVPFLDYRLVEFGLSLPVHFLDSPFQLKRVLVEAMKGILPEKVRQRKDKKGFITPEERWFKQDYKEEFINYFKENSSFAKNVINTDEAMSFLKRIQSPNSPFNPNYWHIIVFSVWMKTFNVQLEK